MLNPILLAVCALLFCGLIRAAAQAPSAPAPPVVPAKLEVLITDERGRFVEGLRAQDLRLSINGVTQQVTGVEQVSKPVTYGLVVDNSGSLRTQFGAVMLTAQALIASNQPGDETFIVRFVHRDAISILQPVTADPALLRSAIGRMRVEGGQTALIDALYTAAEHLLKERTPDNGRRRSILLISDGEERASLRKTDELLKLLRGTGIQLFCVGLVAELEEGAGFINKSKRDRAIDLLKELAAETGGLAFFPEKVAELQESFNEIVRHLRSQHEVTYTLASNLRPADIRKVELKVSPGPGGKKRRAYVRQPAAVTPSASKD
jgi:Ca-activated chloride channel homolog